MLSIENLSFAMAGRPLFRDASARIPAGHRVGLIGPNGAGKSTLLRLIDGELAPDSGRITCPERTRIGALAQEAPAGPASLIETVIAADSERATLMDEAGTATDPGRIGEVNTRLAEIDAWSAEGRAAAILKGLGFDEAAQARPLDAFSGGWRMRVALAGLLFSRPDILLLDEPTNHLDLEGTLWLEGYLARYPGTVLLVSHDRALLNAVPQAIMAVEERGLVLYRGNFDACLRARQERRARQAAETKKQERRRAEIQRFVDRFRAQANKARQAQSRLKMLERMQPVTPPAEAAARVFRFPAPEALAPPLMAIDGVSAGYEGRAVLSRLNLRLDPDDRIALLGRNGEGKSTFARLLAGDLAPLSGRITRARGLRAGHFAQHQMDALRAQDTPLAHMLRARPGENETKLRARLAGFGIDADAAVTPAGSLSGGQRARLALTLCTLEAPHLLILDEPTNHLDIESREALIEALAGFAGAVVIVSHDMHLLAHVADRLWLVEGGRVSPFEGDLSDYRARLLAPSAASGTPGATKPAKPRRPREPLSALRSEARRCEARLEKLSEMRARLDEKLADRTLYAPERAGELAIWQKKHAEVLAGLDRAEALWERALERLETAEADQG